MRFDKANFPPAATLLLSTGLNASVLLICTALLLLSSLPAKPLFCEQAAQAKSKAGKNKQDFASGENTANNAGVIHETISAGGLIRDYYIHVPVGYTQGMSLPVVLVFHGGYDFNTRMDAVSRFDAIADRENFIVVYPQGVNDHWNDTRNVNTHDNYDDLSFISGLIDHMVRRYRANPQRFYACGYSAGGYFAQYLGIQIPEKLAAIASVSATLPEKLYHAKPALKPISVLYILGMEDPIMPFKGGPSHTPTFHDTGNVIAAPLAVQFWVKANHASKTPESVYLPDTDPTDGTRVRVATFGNGLHGNEVVVYGIEGGGHGWPGGPQLFPVSQIGQTSRDIHAGEVIWDFFKRHESY